MADVEESTPLHIIGWRYREYDFMEMFFKINDDLQQTVQVNARDELGNTPLHVAMSYYNKKIPESLLRRGADPNSANEKGSTPLHIICQREQNNEDDFAELFFRINDDIQQTVQVDARDNLGRTPLQLAVANRLPHVIDILLDRGANLSSFVFPTESYFVEGFRKGLCENRYEFKFRLAFCALSVVERLEKRGHELSRNDALTIMNTLFKHNIFFNFSPLEIWRSDEEFAIAAKKITVSPSLSLYDLIQLPYEEAAKKLTYTDYFKLCGSIGLQSLGYENGEDYIVYLCGIMWREFFRRWALDLFLELTRYRLPILCCDMIMKELKNKDFLHICWAATGRNSWWR
uniref:Uncharacterized protein n=1 Tax=Trichogramma kaykai TaxID=54128 RepID=A0ABD2X4J6_9HYME